MKTKEFKALVSMLRTKQGWVEYNKKVQDYESQGITTSDAQGIVDAEEIEAGVNKAFDTLAEQGFIKKV